MESEHWTGPWRRAAAVTKTTEITRTAGVVFFVAFVLCAAFVTQPSARAAQASQAAPRATSWPQFRGSPQMTGVAVSDVPQALSLKWTYQAGETIESSAAIADGVVFVGSGDGDLLAIDLETGKLKWKYATGNPLGESSPAVGGGLVYIGDLGGIVHAVHTSDGSKAWTFKTGGEVKSSPAIAGDDFTSPPVLNVHAFEPSLV